MNNRRKEMMNSGMNRRDALRLWKEWGGTVDDRVGTGETILRHPKIPKRVIVINNRRKDAPRELTTALKRIMKA